MFSKLEKHKGNTARLRLVLLSSLLVFVPAQGFAEAPSDVRSGVFGGEVDVGVAKVKEEPRKKRFRTDSTRQYYTPAEAKQAALKRKKKPKKAASLGTIEIAKSPAAFESLQKKPKKVAEKKPEPQQDSFAVPEEEAKAAERLKDSLDVGMFERIVPTRPRGQEARLIKKAKSEGRVKDILETMDDVSKRLVKSGLGPGPVGQEVGQGGMIDRLKAVSDQVDRAVDPSIERNEKARSNRF